MTNERNAETVETPTAVVVSKRRLFAGRRKIAVLALGAVGLAGSLTLAATLAPDRAAHVASTYVPRDSEYVVARVVKRDPQELATRKALAASPDRVELAVEIARNEIQRARSLGDPRYLGRAQATLGRWWNEATPPPDVLLLRATIEQSLHNFKDARRDLDQLIIVRPDDAQAQLTRAVVATVTSDYRAARASCAAVTRIATPLIAAACQAPIDGLTGNLDATRDHLAGLLAATRYGDPAILGWAWTVLAELDIQRGDLRSASTALGRALDQDGDDTYARGLLADVMIEDGRPADASALLVGREQIDALLVRRAIAEKLAHGAETAALVQQMRDRIAAARDRGDRIHLREEARFSLVVDGDARAALPIAAENFAVQQELADARLLAAAAVAAHEPIAATPVIAWARSSGVHDAQLARSLPGLGGLQRLGGQ